MLCCCVEILGVKDTSQFISLKYLTLMLLLMVAQIVAIFFASIDFRSLANEVVSNAWDAQIVDSSVMASYEIQVSSLSYISGVVKEILS